MTSSLRLFPASYFLISRPSVVFLSTLSSSFPSLPPPFPSGDAKGDQRGVVSAPLSLRDSGLKATAGVNSDGNMSLTCRGSWPQRSHWPVRQGYRWPQEGGRAQGGAEAPRGRARAGSGGGCLRPRMRTQCLG